MFSNPMSPEMVRIVHERQLHEAAVRRANRHLADPGQRRPALRLVVGSALIRAGRLIANDPVDLFPEGQNHRRHLHLVPRPDEGVSPCSPSS